jgi:UDP-N-acetylmuramate dehydrogenase
VRGFANEHARAQASVDSAKCEASPVLAALGAEAALRDLVIARDEPLSRHTTFRIGGPADLLIAASNPTELEQIVRLAWSYKADALVLGGGSNMLVSDAGVRGLTIANQARAIEPHSAGAVPAGRLPQVVAESGAALAGLARWCIRNGWSGLEWAVSVPGTVGGAIIGNAGAHGGEISDNLAWVVVALPEGGRALLTADDLAYTYRASTLAAAGARGPAPVVLTAGFEVVRGDVADMQARAETFLARRRATQPVEPSVGSIFRNPPGDYAGRLVEQAGLKGHRAGGACISIRHANFIVNDTGQATAADVLTLIDLMRARVYGMAGVELIPEILFVGDWSQRPPYMPICAPSSQRT